MGIAISAKAAREAAAVTQELRRLERFSNLAESKFKSVFAAIRSKMSVGEMYVPAVAVKSEDMDDFKDVMTYFGYVVQCQTGKIGNCDMPKANWVAEYSIWFNK